MIRRRTTTAALAALFSVAMMFGASLSASATTPSLPSTTTWTTSGLNEMVTHTGRISVSTDGAGFLTSGTIQVNKPATTSTVRAAYLTSSVFIDPSLPTNTVKIPGVTLAGTAVSFTHNASITGAGFTCSGQGDPCSFQNYFADVTGIVKPVVDAVSSAGVIDLALAEGLHDSDNEGESLVVIFDNVSGPTSSVTILFGTTNTLGDSFTFGFPAITNPNTQVPTLSLGISHGYQTAQMMGQQSDLKIATSSNSTLRTVSLTAGGYDDSVFPDALFTVGGVGDTSALPASGALEDELYDLSSFLAVGDTSLTINTKNATGDDNLFLAVLYFEGVTISGVSPGASVQTTPSSPSGLGTGNGGGVNASTQLANTGAKSQLPIALIGLMFLFAGISVYSGSFALKRSQKS